MEEIATEKQALFKSGKVLFEALVETDSSEEESTELPELQLFSITPAPSNLVKDIRESMIEQEKRTGWKFFSNIDAEDYALFLSKYLPHGSVYTY